MELSIIGVIIEGAGKPETQLDDGHVLCHHQHKEWFACVVIGRLLIGASDRPQTRASPFILRASGRRGNSNKTGPLHYSLAHELAELNKQHDEPDAIDAGCYNFSIPSALLEEASKRMKELLARAIMLERGRYSSPHCCCSSPLPVVQPCEPEPSASGLGRMADWDPVGGEREGRFKL